MNFFPVSYYKTMAGNPEALHHSFGKDLFSTYYVPTLCEAPRLQSWVRHGFCSPRAHSLVGKTNRKCDNDNIEWEELWWWKGWGQKDSSRPLNRTWCPEVLLCCPSYKEVTLGANHLLSVTPVTNGTDLRWLARIQGSVDGCGRKQS